MSSRARTVLSLVIALVIVVLLVVLAINKHIDEADRNERTEKLIEESKKRADEQSKDKKSVLDFYKGNYEESKLTEDDIDLTKVYQREDVMSHAKLILGIIDDESREKAMYDLPLTHEASAKHFSNNKNIYYGKYTDDVSISIKFAGLNYSSSEENYTANVIADVTYYGSEGESEVNTVNLVIQYEKLKISAWSY